eukprot:4430859-Amphidinium_carterae.1
MAPVGNEWVSRVSIRKSSPFWHCCGDGLIYAAHVSAKLLYAWKCLKACTKLHNKVMAASWAVSRDLGQKSEQTSLTPPPPMQQNTPQHNPSTKWDCNY